MVQAAAIVASWTKPFFETAFINRAARRPPDFFRSAQAPKTFAPCQSLHLPDENASFGRVRMTLTAGDFTRPGQTCETTAKTPRKRAHGLTKLARDPGKCTFWQGASSTFRHPATPGQPSCLPPAPNLPALPDVISLLRTCSNAHLEARESRTWPYFISNRQGSFARR